MFQPSLKPSSLPRRCSQRIRAACGISKGRPAFCFGWFYIWPWAAREANLSPWRLARTVLLPTWGACTPLLLIICLERYFDFPGFKDSFTILAFESLLALLVGGVCLWHFALKPDERAKFASFFAKFLSKGSAA